MTSLLALFLILIGAGLFVGYQYVHSQYYVGTKNGNVVIFRGLDQQIFGLSLSSVYRTTSLPVAGLKTQDRQAIHMLSSGSLSQANRLVSNITIDYRSCQQADAASGTGRRPPTPKPTSTKRGKIIRHASQDPASRASRAPPTAAIERDLTAWADVRY